MRAIILWMFLLALAACTNTRPPVASGEYQTPSTVEALMQEMEATNPVTNATTSVESIVQERKTDPKPEPKIVERLNATCHKGEDIRKLHNVSWDDGSCQLYYEHSGEENTVAAKKDDLIYCKMLYTRMRINFIDSGFSCK